MRFNWSAADTATKIFEMKFGISPHLCWLIKGNRVVLFLFLTVIRDTLKPESLRAGKMKASGVCPGVLTLLASPGPRLLSSLWVFSAGFWVINHAASFY